MNIVPPMNDPFPSSFVSFFFWHTLPVTSRKNEPASKQASKRQHLLNGWLPARLPACHHLMPGFGVNQCGNWILFHTLFISMIWSFDSQGILISLLLLLLIIIIIICMCDTYTISLKCSLPVSEFMQFQDWSQIITGLVWTSSGFGHFHQEFRESD